MGLKNIKRGLEIEGNTINTFPSQIVEAYDFWTDLTNSNWSWTDGGGHTYDITRGVAYVRYTSSGSGFLLSPDLKGSLLKGNIAFSASVVASMILKNNGASGDMNAYVQLTDGGANTTNLLQARGYMSSNTYTTYSTSAEEYGGGAMGYAMGTFNLSLTDNNINITFAGNNYSNGAVIGSGTEAHSSSVVSDDTDVDISTWANVYLKLYVVGSGSTSAPPMASISPITFTTHKLGSLRKE